jgi:hypothetical protein
LRALSGLSEAPFPAIATVRGSGAVIGGHPPQVAVLEPIAVSLEADDLGVMDEAVDHGRGHHGVTEDLAPATELLVRGDLARA